VTKVEGENPATVPFGAGDDGGVDEAKGKIGVAADEILDPLEVAVAAVKNEFAIDQVGQKIVEHRHPKLLFDKVRHFPQRCGRNRIRRSFLAKRGRYSRTGKLASIQ
jgi:hypothetical protein